MRVVVVDDNDLWRSSLVSALTSRGITVVSEFADGDELQDGLPALAAAPVDVAVLDLRLPPTWSDEGIHLGHTLRSHFHSIGVIILSGYEQDVQLQYATRALDGLAGSGGVGYLFKDRTTRTALKDAVHRVAAGRVVVDPLFAQQAADEYHQKNARIAGFSEREVEILNLLVQGLSNKEIADTLYLSIAAIERHLTKIFRMLEVGAADVDGHGQRKENRRVLTVLEWLRRTGRIVQ